jgi:predicted enzyme related to lactoylglutathione lyase
VLAHQPPDGRRSKRTDAISRRYGRQMHVEQSRILLRPTHFEQSAAFYEGIGLTRYREWGEVPQRGVVYFLGGGFLELNEGPPPEPPHGMRLWLQVADVHAVHDELRELGVKIDAPPERKPWGLIEMMIHDPDGLPLVIVETPVTHPLRRRA